MNSDIIRLALDEFVEELRNPSIIEEPECESPIEEQFLWEFNKVAHDQVTVRRQVEVETYRGRFRLDFVLERLSDGKAIGVECDGKNFHSAERDSKRDAAIVGTGVVDKIYRLRGSDICWHIYELLELLGWCEPWIISDRGRVNLDARTLPASQRHQSKGDFSIFFPFAAIRTYEDPPDDPEDIVGDMEAIYPHRPILLAWTQKI